MQHFGCRVLCAVCCVLCVVALFLLEAKRPRVGWRVCAFLMCVVCVCVCVCVCVFVVVFCVCCVEVFVGVEFCFVCRTRQFARVV